MCWQMDKQPDSQTPYAGSDEGWIETTNLLRTATHELYGWVGGRGCDVGKYRLNLPVHRCATSQP